MAARVALVLLPMIGLCLLEPVGREACACCGMILVSAAIWLRFRDRAGVTSVTTGLLAGVIPLVAALALSRFDPGCAVAGIASYCTAFSLLIGSMAGGVVAVRETRAKEHAGSWIFSAGVAALAATLGCVRLGVASIAGVALGIVVGRAATLLLRPRADLNGS